jgi:hypothetical protein
MKRPACFARPRGDARPNDARRPGHDNRTEDIEREDERSHNPKLFIKYRSTPLLTVQHDD